MGLKDLEKKVGSVDRKLSAVERLAVALGQKALKEEGVGSLGEVPKPVKEEKPFAFKLKIPSKVSRESRKKDVFAVLVLDANKNGYFTNGKLLGGNLRLYDGVEHNFENCSVFSVGKKKVPLIVVYSWRITPVAGFTDAIVHAESSGEEQGVGVVSVERDDLFARKYGLSNYGQQTIIRSIQQSRLPDLVKKGFGGLSPLWMIIGGVVVLYFIQQMFVGG